MSNLNCENIITINTKNVPIIIPIPILEFAIFTSFLSLFLCCVLKHDLHGLMPDAGFQSAFNSRITRAADFCRIKFLSRIKFK